MIILGCGLDLKQNKKQNSNGCKKEKQKKKKRQKTKTTNLTKTHTQKIAKQIEQYIYVFTLREIVKVTHLLFLECRFVKDEVDSNHLDKNRAIAKRVAQCCQPGSEITQCHHNLRVSGGDDKEICIHVQDDGPTPYQVVQIGAAQTYQPGGKRTQTCSVTDYVCSHGYLW